MPQPTKVDAVVGANIRLRRTALGLTQADLGSLVNLTAQQISKYESGEDALAAHRLADVIIALKCPIGALFEGVLDECKKLDNPSKGAVVMMGHYNELPEEVQESMREMMKAMKIALGRHLQTERQRNV